VWGWYLASRVVGVLLLLPESGALSDISYFDRMLARQGLAKALPEYPWPAVALLDLPLQAGVSSGLPYYIATTAFFLAVDAAFAFFLWRAAGGRMSRGLVVWLALVPVLGPVVFTRFDHIAAAAAAAALFALAASRPFLAGGLAAIGCGIKLWPVLGVPALLVPGGWRERRGVVRPAPGPARAESARTVSRLRRRLCDPGRADGGPRASP